MPDILTLKHNILIYNFIIDYVKYQVGHTHQPAFFTTQKRTAGHTIPVPAVRFLEINSLT